MEYEERGGGFKTVAGMRWCLAEMGRYVVMQHNRMKEEVTVAGKLVCFMSPECLTHTCGTEVRPSIKISLFPVQHGDGRGCIICRGE